MAFDEALRKRRSIACQACRKRKRKCDGKQPCDICAKLGISRCQYRSIARDRRTKVEVEESREPVTDSPQYETAVQSNSSATFARLLTRSIDPHQTVPVMMPAWNVYLGERTVPDLPACDSIAEIMSAERIRHFSDVYLAKVQPCYGFLPLGALESAIVNSQQDTITTGETALLCGVVALGSYFDQSQDWAAETQCVNLAKRYLDPAEMPTLFVATASLLRTVYLRLTAKPEEAWLSSCTTLHLIDAAGICRPVKYIQESRKLFDVATHLNIWSSFDLGRRRVVLQNDNPLPPEKLAGHYTDELLGLLPYSRDLDPANVVPPDTLTTALREVIDRSHSAAPSILAQCNLMLCIYRRLHASKTPISDELLGGVLTLIGSAISAVHSCMKSGLPWHHVASIPFQALCTLLAIDTAQSIAMLGTALSCLQAVSDLYGTTATKEAATAGYAIVELHKAWREAEVRRHSELLSLYPSTLPQVDDTEYAWMDAWWFNEFVASGTLDANSLLQTL